MTCLLQSFQQCNFIEKLTPFELDKFMKLQSIKDQFIYLTQISMLPLKISNTKLVKNWNEVEKYCQQVIGNGILLMWGDVYQVGHAVPVINGEIKWLFQDQQHEFSKYLTNINISNIKSKY
jgi:hypothetical protein